MSKKPILGGLHTSSALWQSIWSSWKEVRQHVFVRTPLNLDEVLSLPTCGVRGVWKEERKHFFFSAQVVSELTRVSALTLFSFWEPKQERWMTSAEMAEGGVRMELAAQIEVLLQTSLKPQVQAATSVRWKPQQGD